jgi:hypothetical protein
MNCKTNSQFLFFRNYLPWGKSWGVQCSLGHHQGDDVEKNCPQISRSFRVRFLQVIYYTPVTIEHLLYKLLRFIVLLLRINSHYFINKKHSIFLWRHLWTTPKILSWLMFLNKIWFVVLYVINFSAHAKRQNLSGKNFRRSKRSASSRTARSHRATTTTWTWAASTTTSKNITAKTYSSFSST